MTRIEGLKRAVAGRAALARLRRRLEEDGLGVWKATKREVERFGLSAGDYVVTSRDGIVGSGSLDDLCRRHGALEAFETIEIERAPAPVPAVAEVPSRARRRARTERAEDEGQGSLPF